MCKNVQEKEGSGKSAGKGHADLALTMKFLIE
jgi:hypothetical protein